MDDYLKNEEELKKLKTTSKNEDALKNVDDLEK